MDDDPSCVATAFEKFNSSLIRHSLHNKMRTVFFRFLRGCTGV